MSIFNKVTLQSLKKNKTRTIVTIIGIMLSTAMICAVTTFISSMRNYALQFSIYSEGDWHGAVYSVDWSGYEKISTAEKVADSTYGQLLGYAEIDSNNEYKPYLYVIGGKEDSFFDMLPVHLISGEYPKDSTEIILPGHLADNGGLIYEIGDTIELDLGERMKDGYSLNQNNPCYNYDDETGEETMNEETIEVRETRTYTVVGFYERASFEGYTAPGYTALTVADKEFNNAYQFDVYFKMKKAADIYDFMDEMQITGKTNTDLLLYYGVSGYDGFTSMLYGLGAIVIGLIMFGSISLIYNAFSISVSERTRQFGLLSSIGATKKQLRSMVLFEAMAVSLVGIPLGICVGISGISITLLLIGHRFAALTGNFEVPMSICVSAGSIVAAVIVAIVTVLISAWIPSRRAMKVSAVEAIRQNMDIRTKNKSVKTSKLTYKIFGLPGVLASKYYKRSKKKYRATVVSLFMSIVLFVSAAAFTDYLMESVTGGYGTNGYDLYYYAGSADLEKTSPDEVLELFKSDENIQDIICMRTANISGLISQEYLSEDMKQAFEDSGNIVSNEGVQIYGYVYFVPDSEFEALLKQYNLDRETYMNQEAPLGISVDGVVTFDYSKEKYVTINLLDSDKAELKCKYEKSYEGYYYENEEINEDGSRYYLYRNNEDEEDVMRVLADEAEVEYTLKSGKTIYEYPYYIPSTGQLNIIYPSSMFKFVIPEEIASDFGRYDYYMISDNHAASYENLKKVLGEKGLDSAALYDYAESVEENRNIVIIIKVFSYGFIVLISLIAAANVFNTISTNISLRRREFAMLKSVGMTDKGFNRMMNFECLLYGSRELMFGLPVSAGITYLIYCSISEGYESTYHLPWGAVGVSVLSVFAVVFVTMMYSMSKIKKDNPIEALKNENL